MESAEKHHVLQISTDAKPHEKFFEWKLCSQDLEDLYGLTCWTDNESRLTWRTTKTLWSQWRTSPNRHWNIVLTLKGTNRTLRDATSLRIGMLEVQPQGDFSSHPINHAWSTTAGGLQQSPELPKGIEVQPQGDFSQHQASGSIPTIPRESYDKCAHGQKHRLI